MLDAWQRGRPEPRAVLAGDLNASAGHPGFDHVLTRGLAVESFEAVRVPGSDHDAILVDLVW